MHYASLVFEGLRVYNRKIFKLEEHIDRLFNSARILDMKIHYSNQEIIEATKKLVSDQDIKDGYTDSLMLDHEGNVAEATSANIFFKDKSNELHTPIPVSFLNGITRKTDIDLAKTKNIKINERKISPDELSNFVGCFITGTAAEITPVANILDNKFEVCSLIKDLSSSYEILVEKNS